MILITSVLSCTPAARYNRSLDSVSLVAYHRMHATYAETTHVAPGELFLIGDGEYAARVVQYIPDFQIDDDYRVRSRSDSARNAAVRLEVHHNGERTGFTWAFLGSEAPHFRRNELLAFRLIKLTVQGTSIEESNETTP